MRRLGGFGRGVCALGGAAVVSGALVLTMVGGAVQPAAVQGEDSGAFMVDGVHSAVFFSIGHLGVSKSYGMFFSPEGSYLLDPTSLADSFIDISISLEHLETGNEKRDEHLRNADFFNATAFPKITYRADTFKLTGVNSMRSVGQLTMLGVSRPVSADITIIGESETRQGYKSGFEAMFTINRSDFGMLKYVESGALGDEVELRVSIEGVRRGADE